MGGRNRKHNKPQASDLYDAGQLYVPLTGKTTWSKDYNTSFKQNVPASSRKTMTSRARQLYANMGAIKNGIQEKAEFTIGDGFNKATFVGSSVTWSTPAKKFLDVKLQEIQIQQRFREISIAIERDGDCLLVFTRWNNGIELYAGDQVGSRFDGKIKSGPYAGMEMYDGVITDRYGNVAGYNVLGEKDNGEDDIIFSSFDSILIFDPDYIKQRRGITALAQAIPIFEQYKQIVDYEIRGIKHASSFAVQAHVEQKDIPKFTGNIAGYPKGFGTSTVPVSSSLSPTGQLDVNVEEIQGGAMHVFRAGSGAKLEVLNSDRPSQNTATFLMDHCLRQAFLSLRWPVELSYDLNSRGATTKLVISKATRTIDSRQSLIFRPLWKRIVTTLIARAISDKVLPFNKDFYKWLPDYPAQMTIDTFRDTKSDVEAYNKGWMTGQQVSAQYGYDYYANLRQKAEEVKYAKELAEEMDLPLETLIQMTPNGNMQSNSPEVEKSEDTDTDTEKENEDETK